MTRRYPYDAPPDATEVAPRLWLGNRGAALSPAWLAEQGIRAVFNCTKDIPFAPAGGATPPMRRYRVPVDDDLSAAQVAALGDAAPEVVLKLGREYRRGEPVLVHCAAGMQRSAAVCAMFLMAAEGVSAEHAMAYLRSRRPVTFFPSANFAPALRRWEAALAAAAGGT